MRFSAVAVVHLAAWSVAGSVIGQEATKSFFYSKTKQADLEMVVHFPPGWTETDKRPGIVFFFGGGWENGTIKAFEPQAKYFASRGMVAARADYRVKSRHGITPRECVDDARAAMRWFRENAGKLGVDPNRIVASGGSAGGHIAACTTLMPDSEAKGDDSKVSCKANALLLFNPVLRFGPQLLKKIDNDEDLSKAISPTLHLEKDSPPTLLFFGTDDWLIQQGEEFVARSKELGHRAELFVADGQPHGFFHKLPWKERTLQRADEFLMSLGYLQGKATIAAPNTGKGSAQTTSDRGPAKSEVRTSSEPPAEPKKRKALAPIVEKGLREGIEFAKVGDVSLTLDAFVPEGDGPFPACILVHGGGFMRGDKQTYITPLFEPLSKAGFVWFTIDYRLAPKHRWPACAEDVDAAIRWVKTHEKDYKVDPRRIVLIGESAGGHLVSYAGIRATEATRLAAVVPIYAPHDLEFQVRHRNALGESMTALLGLTELNDAAYVKLREISPSSYVRGGLPPFLLLHGDKDAQVPFEQSPRFQKQMRAAGNTCDLITIPGGAHGMGQWDERLPGWKDQLVDWLKETLK